MPACSSIAVTGPCRPCECAAVLAMPVRPPLTRSAVLGDTGSAFASVNVRSLLEVAAPLPGCALRRACPYRCASQDGLLPHQGKDADSAYIINSTIDSSMSSAASLAPPGERSCSPLGSSAADRRSSLLVLPPARGAVSVGSHLPDSAPSRKAIAETLASLLPSSAAKVKAVSESVSVLLSAQSAIVAAELSSVPFPAPYLPRGPSYPLRRGRRSGSKSKLSIFAPPHAPTLYATEEELPVCVDPEGVRCCPLLDPQCEEGVLSDGQINLSPFLNWKFVPYLSPQAEGQARPTVVLDMDETLLHTSVVPMDDADAEVDVPCPPDDARGAAASKTSTGYTLFVKYRPHLREFLLFCVQHFEVVIFTASKAFYAHAVLRKLQEDFPDIAFRLNSNASGNASASQRVGDKTHAIEVLNRDHCTPTNVGYTKDLHLIGRDLRRTILVDNNKVCGIFQPYNTVHVKDFARRRSALRAAPQHQMREMQLRYVRRAIPASSVTMAEDAAASPSLRASEDDNCAHLWEDPEDAVLLRLCAAGGLLHRLSQCENVPSFMQRTVRFNRAASG
ncbi:hypothetical protein LSCM1_01112 [Leishmania martiniquensis]|uniref:Mitochondrial import inner membrane translocase subunit TIM50 n=1 Tax=Leishmania martiniquensis TaxID=1580590 RepID=A0A836GK20_9TRYP|nr:hypothetical protein LSCM1_01112 [Leishmania martiniquensis]